MGKKGIIVAISLAIVLVSACIWLFYDAQNRSVDEQLITAFSEVHEGIGVSQAASYKGSGPHEILLLDFSGGRHGWTTSIPIEWRSKNVTGIELVVLVGEEKENVLGTCSYYGPSVTRYQYSVEAELREAKTGKIVASITLYGSEPRHCGQTEDYHLTRLEGSHVSFSQLSEWLRQYVVP